MKKKIFLLVVCLIACAYVYLKFSAMMQKRAHEQKVSELEETFSVEQNQVKSANALDNIAPQKLSK